MTRYPAGVMARDQTAVDEDLDRQLIIRLAQGISRRDKRERALLPIYPAKGAEEDEARRALARVLKTSKPLDLGLRFWLAEMIDPDDRDVDRKFEIKYRRKGKRSNVLGESEIAEFIWARVQTGTKQESVISSALKHFGYGAKSRRYIMKIWKHWKPILQQHYHRKPLR